MRERADELGGAGLSSLFFPFCPRLSGMAEELVNGEIIFFFSEWMDHCPRL